MSNDMMKLYNRDEVIEYLKGKYTEIVAKYIDEGYQIEPSDYSSVELKNGKEQIRLNFLDDASGASIYIVNLHKQFSIEFLMKYRTLTRNGLYISEEDFLTHVKPKRKAREKQKETRNNISYKVSTKNLPDKILDKLKKFDGFKRVTRENLKIYKVVNRYNATYFFNSGTKPVLSWETTQNGLQKNWLEGSDQFNIRYNQAR